MTAVDPIIDEALQSEGVAFMDGRYVPLGEAAVPILDRGFLRSDVTYDVAHVWKGRFFRLGDHVERFRASMDGLRLAPAYSDQEIAEIMIECTRRAGLQDAFVLVCCTRGVPPPGVRDPRRCRNRIYAFAQPFVWFATPEQLRDGFHMILAGTQRIPMESLDQRIKNFHWLDLTMSTYEAFERDAHVSVLPDARGAVTEGPGFNIFAVKDGVLATPDRGMFEGITRRSLMEIAAELQIRCEVRPVMAAELAEADEILACTTAGGVAPVTRFDGRPVAAGRPGPITTRLHDLYWARHFDPAFSSAIDYGTPVAPVA